MTRHRGDSGFVAAWTVMMLVALVGVVGLVFDGGRVMRARSAAFGAAASAARAGAQEIDEREAVQGRLRLDPDLAQQAAEDHLAAWGVVGHVFVSPDELLVTVTVTGETDLAIFPGSIDHVLTATAQAQRGN